MILREWLRHAETRLQAAGVASPSVDARALLLHVLGAPAPALILRGHEPLPDEAGPRLAELLARREAREPLQHLLGEVDWGGLRLSSDARALIPRPETEWLLHLALQGLRGVPAPRVVDVGTGTGALALGVKAARPDADVTATDLSADALALARENAGRNGLDVTLVQADLLTGVPGPFDLILSNPPYLPDADALTADPEVRHDPPLALYSGPDGLDLPRRLCTQAQDRLTPGGTLWLELDPRNAPTLAAELRAAGWSARLHADLTGRERFVQATLTPRP